MVSYVLKPHWNMKLTIFQLFWCTDLGDYNLINLDLIVLNSLNDEGAGFSVDTNKITIISKGNKSINFPLKDKKSVSLDIVNNIIELINE